MEMTAKEFMKGGLILWFQFSGLIITKTTFEFTTVTERAQVINGSYNISKASSPSNISFLIFLMILIIVEKQFCRK